MDTVLKCRFCHNQFNSNERAKINIPCGHSICKQCLFSQNPPPFNEFLCPFDDKMCYMNEDDLLYDLDFLEHYHDQASLICEDHNKEIEYYCQKDSKLICHLCFFTHCKCKTQITEIDAREVISSNKIFFSELKKLNNVIQSVIKNCEETFED